MTNMNLGRDAGAGSIALAQSGGELLGMLSLDEVHGATAKTAAGEACADEASEVLGEFDHCVGLFAAGLKVLAVADVGLGHQEAEFLHVVADEGVGSSDGAGVLGDDV